MIDTYTIQPCHTQEPACDIPSGFRSDATGVIWLRTQNKRDTATVEEIRICGPVFVKALARNQQGGDWGRVLCWCDLDGRTHRRALPAQRFHEMSFALAQELAAEGLEIVPGHERKVMEFLGSFRPTARVQCVDALGWLNTIDDRLAFVLPDRVISRETLEEVVFQTERHSPTVDTIAGAGSLKEWQDAVASKVLGNPLLMFGICSGLAAVLLKHTNLDSGGFHLHGVSSRGKTTWLQVAASVWGCGADPGQAGNQAMLRRWTVTANGAEGLAAAHNDLILPLDEIGSCTSRDFGALVYMLSGGLGKTAMDASRNLKGVRTWRTIILSTGEVASRQQIEEDLRRRVSAGQLLRLIDIPGGDQIITVTYGSRPADYADALKSACGKFYGTAGPAFVERLVAEYPDAPSLRGEVSVVLGLVRSDLTPPHVGAEVARVCKRFALVATAGVLACRWGILPWQEEQVVNAVRVVRDLWLSDTDTLTDADRGVIAVRDFCLQNAALFRSGDFSDAVVHDIAGYRRADAFMFITKRFKDACGGVNPKLVLRELQKRRLLECSDADHLASKVIISTLRTRPRLYIVREEILEVELDT